MKFVITKAVRFSFAYISGEWDADTVSADATITTDIEITTSNKTNNFKMNHLQDLVYPKELFRYQPGY